MTSGPTRTALDRAASTLLDARTNKEAVVPFTDTDDRLDESWGYEVQSLDRNYRLAEGEGLVGAKLGLTSEAKQRRMGVDRPIVGFLTEPMLISPASVVDHMPKWIHPRIEPEIAFVTSLPISDPLDLAGAAEAVAGVAVAAEIIDSRFADYRFRLADVLADNTSAAGVLLGPMRPLGDADGLLAARCTVIVDGEVAHEATGAAILGNPLLAVVLLSEHLARRGEVLPAGSVVLAGALTDAVPLHVGSKYDLEIEGLGRIEVRV